jgi:hypothetical protein
MQEEQIREALNKHWQAPAAWPRAARSELNLPNV